MALSPASTCHGCYDVPVMKILEEYKAMGVAQSVHGRRAHNPFALPSYPYEAGRTSEATTSMDAAKKNTTPVVYKGGQFVD